MYITTCRQAGQENLDEAEELQSWENQVYLFYHFYGDERRADD